MSMPTADSLVRWEWRWHDGTGDPMETSRWLQRLTKDSADLALVGLSSSTVDLPPCPLECLVLGEFIGENHDIDLPAARLYARGAIGRRNAVNRGALDRLRCDRRLALLAEAGKGGTDIGFKVAG